MIKVERVIGLSRQTKKLTPMRVPELKKEMHIARPKASRPYGVKQGWSPKERSQNEKLTIGGGIQMYFAHPPSPGNLARTKTPMA